MSWEPLSRPSAPAAAASHGPDPFPPLPGDSVSHPWESAWDSQEPSPRYGLQVGACTTPAAAPKASSPLAKGSSRKYGEASPPPGAVRKPEVKWKLGGGLAPAKEEQPGNGSSSGNGDGRRSEEGPIQPHIQPQALRHAPQAPSLLADLPCTLLHEIFRCLENPKDLGRASCCCRLFRQLALESLGWQRFYCDRWRPPPSLPRKGSFPGLLHSASSLQTSTSPNQSVSESIQKGPAGDVKLAASPVSPAVKGTTGAAVPAGAHGSQGSQAGADQHSGSPEWWRQLYLHKEKRSAALMGRYDADWMTGHTAGVRCVSVLPQSPVAASVGYDSTVRLWDLDRMLPLAASAPLGDTLRAVAGDWDFLAVGGTDCVVRVWPLAIGCPHFFDIDGLWDAAGALDCQAVEPEDPEQTGHRQPGSSSLPAGGPPAALPPQPPRGSCSVPAVCSPAVPALLTAHTGPVSCLAVRHGAASAPRLFSGSWDRMVVCWDVGSAMVCPERVTVRGRARLRRVAPPPRGSFDLVLAQYQHQDWVWSVAARRGHLFSTAGSAQYSWDVETGTLLRLREGVHQGKALAVEASMAGHYTFTGGEDGFVHMFDERLKGRERRREGGEGGGERGRREEPVTSWLAHGAPVNSLAFEDPWLVSASSDGCCGVMDVGRTMRADRRHTRLALPGVAVGPGWGPGGGSVTFEPLRRLGGAHASILSVDMGHERVVCGNTDSNIRVLDFRRAQGTPSTGGGTGSSQGRQGRGKKGGGGGGKGRSRERRRGHEDAL